jgi:hypothetical protein
MSVQLMEALTASGFGAADAVIAAKVTQKLPGNIPMSVGFEAAGILVGMFGQKFGLGADIRDPIMISALALGGARAARLGMAGKLFQPSQWGSVGGDGGGDSGYAAAASVPVLPASRAPGVRRIGGRGGYGIYPYQEEMGGVAG